MLKNYFLIGWRNITRSRFYAFVNIAGLSVGIAFTLIVGAFVWNEHRVNSQLRHADRQFIIESRWKDPNMGYYLAIFGPLSKELKEEYPSLVANYYRFDGVTVAISKGDLHFKENVSIGDTTLLGMYGFELLHGNAATAMRDPFSVIITQEKALKYFGKTDVVGQSLSVQNFKGENHDFVVSGVLKPMVRNTAMRLNKDNNNQIIIPATNIAWFGRNMEWPNAYIVNFIELQPGIKPEQLKGPIQKLISERAPKLQAANVTALVTSLKDFYFNSNNGLVLKMTYALSAIALFILLMAVINFVNMSVSRSAARMKEIGVRKVLGGLKRQLMAQFLIESIILVAFATIVALIIYVLTKDFFGDIFGKDMPALTAFPLYFIGGLFLLIVAIGVLAGLYPALVLSSLKSVESIKGRLSSVKEHVLLRKSLVGFQFATAIIVFTGAVVIAKQIGYFFNGDLGYNKEYMLAAQVPRNWTPEGVKKIEHIRAEFASMPEVAEAAVSFEIPDGNAGGNISLFRVGADPSTAVTSLLLNTDEHFSETYKIPMAAGVYFSRPGTPFTDSATIVINEAQSKALGYASPDLAIGQQLTFRVDGPPGKIIGVTKNFHFGSMQNAVQPMTMFHIGSGIIHRYLSFRIKPGSTAKTVETLQKKWNALMPGAPFEYKFMDDTLKYVYRSELQLQQASWTATILALIIVLLGIFGLVSLSIQKRTKEIGIRKVLGSSVPGIVVLFLKDFLPIILVAALIACPATWLLMNKWLDGYAYRINLTAAPFVLTLVVLVGVTALLIFFQTIRAALANPVKSIRTE